MVFFLKRCNKGSFHTVRKGARGHGRVDESSDKRKESVEIFHKKRGSSQSSLQVFGADFQDETPNDKLRNRLESAEEGAIKWILHRLTSEAHGLR